MERSIIKRIYYQDYNKKLVKKEEIGNYGSTDKQLEKDNLKIGIV